MTETSKAFDSENCAEEIMPTEPQESESSDVCDSPVEAEDVPESEPLVCPDDLSDLEFDRYYASVTIPDFDDIPDDDERYISNSSRMRAFLQEKDTAESVAKAAPPAKKTVRSMVSNFIYYHKIISILVVIAVIAAAVWGVRAYTFSRIDYNIGIYTEDTDFSPEQLSSIEQSFAGCGKDINGDGKVVVRVRAYNPVGEGIFRFFVKFYCMERDVYSDVKHGRRLNDILITDEALGNLLQSRYSTNFFDRLDGDEYWLPLSSSVLPEDISSELGVMLLSSNIYTERETAVIRYSHARDLLNEMNRQGKIQ